MLLRVVFGVAGITAAVLMLREVLPIWWAQIRREFEYDQWAEDVQPWQ